jgi:ankyrin repeat protein
MATSKGPLDVTEILLDQGASIHHRSSDGMTRLLYANSNHQEEMTRTLLDRGAKVHCQDSIGWNPLDYALQNGHQEEMVYLLVQAAGQIGSVSHIKQSLSFPSR